MPSYLWYIVWGDGVSEQFDALSSAEKMWFFAKMSELAVSQDPYVVPGVEPYQEKRFREFRKLRKGNFRMQFKTEPGEITVNKFKYKGKLVIVSIKNRRDAYK